MNTGLRVFLILTTISLIFLLIFCFNDQLFGFKSVIVTSRSEYNREATGTGALIIALSKKTTTNGHCLNNYFKDVLLVITYHYPFYDTLPLLFHHYKGAFPHIVVCGPKQNVTYNVMQVDLGPGWYGFECLGKAIRLHPGFKGYLYVNDDMIVNWWNFVKFDKDKVWLGAPITVKTCHIVGQRPLKKDWMWWKYTNGAEHCEKTHREIKELAQRNDFKRINFKKLLNTFLLNGKNTTYCFKGWSDTFYVPGIFSEEFQQLSKMFFTNKVFLEISVPTILSFLDMQKNWQKGYGTYLPDHFGFVDFIAGEHPWRVYSIEKTLFIHPVKFHASKAVVNRRNMKEIVIAHGTKLLRCQQKYRKL